MGWGSSTRRGGGRKVRALPRSLSSLGFRREESGCPRNFAGMSRTPGGVQKACAKQSSCAFFVPQMFLSMVVLVWQGPEGHSHRRFLVSLDGPIRANRFADSRESSQGSRTLIFFSLPFWISLLFSFSLISNCSYRSDFFESIWQQCRCP